MELEHLSSALATDPPSALAKIRPRLAAIQARHRHVAVVVSPPRCGSTAFSRIFWEHPEFRYYSHEPFEVTYYDGMGMDAVLDKLERPLDLSTCYREAAGASGLVIKEMPYQVGRRIDHLLDLATLPVVFLLRDPRLNIASRMHNKVVGGESPMYPLIESGWQLLGQHIARCRARGQRYLLVDASDFRARAEAVFPLVFRELGLDFFTEQLSWKPCSELELDNLDGRHRHLYRRVLQSSGIEPATEPVPELNSFPVEGGMRSHVGRCLEIYRNLRGSPHCIE